ncbi:MAG: amidohydrolase [Fusobacteriaceae bacterium]|jgi:amidohydrolase|nr:amidohydrolase [Fusobacteriaceae bacterium]
MEIRKLAEKYRDYIVGRRRYYHSHPELSMQEFETTKAVLRDLEEMGIPSVPFRDRLPGCIGTLQGGKPGKTVLLRADIDALPVSEKTGLPYASQNPGVMHACGHDTHIAMLLGAAKILKDLQNELSGTIKFLFQPAEEFIGGAKEVINQGFLKGVDACYGIHSMSGLETGKMNFTYGERMASADACTLKIRGYGAHGSAPHLGKDAIVAASAVIMGIQTIVSRMNNPLNPLVITIGKVDCGRRFNIIADEATLEMTIRCFDKKLREQVIPYIREKTETIAAAYGCTGTLLHSGGLPAVFNNDRHLVEIAQNAVIKLYGTSALSEMEKLTGSEDFAWYLESTPGIYGILGVRSAVVPGSEMSMHHECFAPDERALETGAAVNAQFAFDFLNE